MLGFEDRVSAHRRLLAVVGRICGREARADEVGAMAAYGLDADALDISLVGGVKFEPVAELRLRKFLERFVVRHL